MRSPCPSRYVRYHLRSPCSSTCKKPGLLAHGLTRGSGAATTRVFPANTSRRETYVDIYVNPQTLRTNLLTINHLPPRESRCIWTQVCAERKIAERRERSVCRSRGATTQACQQQQYASHEKNFTWEVSSFENEFPAKLSSFLPVSSPPIISLCFFCICL